jgi:hypothetical protein
MRSFGSARWRALQYFAYLLNRYYALDAQLLGFNSETDLTGYKTTIGPPPQETHLLRSSILQEMRG